jgi:hypothetical protein
VISINSLNMDMEYRILKTVMYTKAITKMENRAAKGYIVGPMEKSMRELSNRACEKAKETGSAKITIFTKDIIARTEKME